MLSGHHPVSKNERLAIVSDLVFERITTEVMDETSDISRTEEVSLCLRYLINGETKETFVGFFATASTEGEVLYELAKTAINNIIAECFDGAANMSGIRKGLATRMKECSPLGIYVHCYGHLLNLALQNTMTENETLGNALGTIQSLYNFLHGSTKRHALFKDIEIHEEDVALTLKSLSTTRWSCRWAARKKIKKGIEGTQFTFRDAKVPRTRPSRRLQSLTGETPAAANDSSQQTEKDYFRITVYYTSIDKVVSELQSRFEDNDQEVLCALGEIVFRRSLSINNIQTLSNFYGVDSGMLSSEKSIFENYDCGDPCQRKNAALMVKTMHQNGLHDILPVLYKVASILATIPATSCSAERSFSALRRIKTFLRSAMGQDRLSSIAVINIERKYAN
ncbi:zinc finger MYM-type protein 1-like [Montipora capricornis]|uniref:zinc finger MYM-type protein 1-like n=1 Tax=Montipora capricornis TaxID=246305 RepID=UPI0035F111E6